MSDSDPKAPTEAMPADAAANASAEPSAEVPDPPSEPPVGLPPEAGAEPTHEEPRPVTMAAEEFDELQPTDPNEPVTDPDEFVPSAETMYAPPPVNQVAKVKAIQRRNTILIALVAVVGIAAAVWWFLLR